ncbi:MAG: hypothetical protein Q4G40_10115 [Brachybacterium sp.]|nr:hypothetical protein [Brachybacterium sp.]
MSSYRADGFDVTIDPDTLRDHVDDPDALLAWCREHPAEARTVAYLRILGHLHEAENLGREMLSEHPLHPLALAARRTRLAHVLQWQGRFEEAEAEFARAAEETGLHDDPTSRSSLLTLASVLQHRAKSRFEQSQASARENRSIAAGRQREAGLEDARRALAIRRGLGADDAVTASSDETVRRLQRPD